MTYQEIVAEVKELCAGAELKQYTKHLAVEVAITGEGEGVFYIEAKDGRINVEPYTYNDRDVRLTASAKNFLAIAKGELDPVKAFMTGKLKVDGSIDKALEFKSVVEEVAAAKK
ncbi:MAG: SCP2 sterol-binding domain-containing protein [Firmicutes bacterium]|nr:SCP2 sterol-binding domain-containing protein [Bacillota bacterium]